MWSAVNRNGCFVKLSRSINFVPPEGHKKLIEWGLPNHLLISAPASAWSLLHLTYLSPILFVCTATHVPWRRAQKAYCVGIAKSFADFCTCFSLVIIPPNMSVSILFVCTATHGLWRTGRTKIALVKLPTVTMVGFFFCAPFPRRILAWSFVVPRCSIVQCSVVECSCVVVFVVVVVV